ncbi:MAG: CoA-binding protein [FCB group bacterium]|nr:CoA-binding protein [FCB group bacterium]
MKMNYQDFWKFTSYAVVAHSEKRAFPRITYRNLLLSGKTVFPVDPNLSELDGHPVFQDFQSLPEKVDGAILEVPREDSLVWIQKAAEAGIGNIWIHQHCDTPEALDWSREKGLNLWHGTCAVMYLTSGFSAHGIHRTINKLFGKY